MTRDTRSTVSATRKYPSRGKTAIAGGNAASKIHMRECHACKRKCTKKVFRHTSRYRYQLPCSQRLTESYPCSRSCSCRCRAHSMRLCSGIHCYPADYRLPRSYFSTASHISCCAVASLYICFVVAIACRYCATRFCISNTPRRPRLA